MSIREILLNGQDSHDEIKVAIRYDEKPDGLDMGSVIECEVARAGTIDIPLFDGKAREVTALVIQKGKPITASASKTTPSNRPRIL